MFDAAPLDHRPRAPASDLDQWAAAALRQIRAGTAAPGASWTPALAGEALVEALRWLRHSTPTPGPRGYATARLPERHLTELDRLAEGWGIAETADDDPPMTPPPRVSPAQAQRHLFALEWPARYVAREHPGSARMLSLWAACRAGRRPFAEAVKARGVDRSLGYRMRDRALGLVAMGLTLDRVPLDPPGR